MKKILFAATVLVYTLLIALSSNAQKAAVPPAVEKSFNEQFKNAQLLGWKPVLNSYIAGFTENHIYREAYFTEDGEFKGVGHHITSDVLPTHIQKKLAERYSGYEITDLYQFDCSEEGICFFVVLKNTKTELIVKMNSYGDVTHVKRTKINPNPATEPMVASKNKN